jgi:RimJ/RimL family protein N-acetyltransferase
VKSWPLFELRVQTPDLVLRLPTDEEIDALASRAVGHVLTPETVGFLDSWTQIPSPEFERSFVAWHWRCRADWSPQKWRLTLAVFLDGQRDAIGTIGLHATEFALCREVSTGSWLLDSARGRGWGRQMRMGILHLAFDHLGARIARSSAHVDNAASLGVSRSIGYREDGTKRTVSAGQSIDLLRLRLDAEEWWCPEGYSVTGLERCRDMFGPLPA